MPLLLLLGGLGSSRKAFGQSSLETTLTNCSDTHSLAVGNAFNGLSQPWDFHRLSQVHTAAANTLASADFDTAFKAQIANVDASSLSLATNDYTSSVQRIQTYAPTFQADDFQFLMNYLTIDPDTTNAALTDLKQNGITPSIQGCVPIYQQMYTDLVAQGGDATAKRFQEPFKRHRMAVAAQKSSGLPPLKAATYNPREQKPKLVQSTWLRPFLTIENGGGGGGYSCAADSKAGLAYGTTIAVVTFMCFFSVVVLICSPVILFWAGTAGAAWGLGHEVKCP